MSNLTKNDIVLQIYRKTRFPQKQIRYAVLKVFELISDALAHGRNIELYNFGALALQVRKVRPGRNPNEPETVITIPERADVKFKAGKEFKILLTKLDLAELKRAGK